MSAEPATFDIEVFQGAYWSQTLLWKDSNGDPIDLTGYTARMQVRKKIQSETVVALLATPEVLVRDGDITLDPTVGYNILLELSAAATAALPAHVSDHRWYYDLELVPSGGEVRRLLMGRFVVSLEVTR